jgi:cytochrome c-type biogenesis protein CcmE
MQRSTLAKIGLTAIVVLGGGGFLITSSILHAQHYLELKDLIATGMEPWKDKELKIEGIVESSSIVEDTVDQETRRTFVIANEGKKLRVFCAGPMPDTFYEKAMPVKVVAMGRLVPAASMQKVADALCAKHGTGDNAKLACPVKADAEQTYVVEATEISAKCPSKYESGPSVKLDGAQFGARQ